MNIQKVSFSPPSSNGQKYQLRSEQQKGKTSDLESHECDDALDADANNVNDPDDVKDADANDVNDADADDENDADADRQLMPEITCKE